MIETVECLAHFRLDKLSKYLRDKGYWCLPRFFYPNPFLNVLIREKNKEKLWNDIGDFKYGLS